LTGVFVLYGLRTLGRQYSKIVIDDIGFSVTGLRRREVAWADLVRVRLSFFPTRKRKGEGIMELSVSSREHRIKIDSGLEDFLEVAARVYREATTRGVPLPNRTIGNFQTLAVTEAGSGASRWGRPSDWLDQDGGDRGPNRNHNSNP
jgi:hypothetical protein